jgi:hypothetical protein
MEARDRLLLDFQSTVSRDLMSLVVGDFIGEGSARMVFAYKPAPDTHVIKFETEAGQFQNICEWETWCWLRDNKDRARWLAPCTDISSNGAILVQRRVSPIRERELPKKLPAFLCDLKPENFGMLDGRVVAADYGTVMSCLEQAPLKLVAAEWR